jgi:hypothetical protein
MWRLRRSPSILPDMPKQSHILASDIRGAGRLAIDATLGLTSLVETMHHNIQRTPGILGESTQQPTRGITGFVYKSVRGVTRLVGGSIDLLLKQLIPLFGGAGSSPEREAVVAALNGVLGDHLAHSANPLAISLALRHAGQELKLTRPSLKASIPQATGKVLLLAHGLCMSDLQWRRHGHDHGAALAIDSGFTPVYLRYNSGLHVSENGRALSAQIQALLRGWPVPVTTLAILGHSMGGLVARSACHHASVAGHDWLGHLRKIVFLGTPHHGAPLERGGHWVDVILAASPYSTAFARLGKIRSAGITDLRHGSVVEEDWHHRDRFARSRRKPLFVPLPAHVKCYAVAASIGKEAAKPSKQPPGDGLVPLRSALGQDSAQRTLSFPRTRRWIGFGMNHLDLLDNRLVYERIRRWL